MSEQDFDALKSTAELTNYEETTRYAEVVRLINELQKRSDWIRVETFGLTEEQRPMPLMILSNPAPAGCREAAASGKPIVFVMANIHAGEVEGKEAMIHLSRRILGGALRPLLDKLVLLIAPIYNADGNEKIALTNRTHQNGPVTGVGTRENARGLDLNRDYMKLDTAEARALVRLMARWDPHLTVDLHTTNGSYHGYHLTYAPTLNPNADARLIAFAREKMLPAINGEMSRRQIRAYYYGNFSTLESFEKELASPPAEGTTVWRTFDHRPRFGNNYVGLRNRLTILSEAYTCLDFKRRVEVTEAFVEEILHYATAHAAEIITVTRDVDRSAAERMRSESRGHGGVEFHLEPLPARSNILVGEVRKVRNPRSGLDMSAMEESAVQTVSMPEYALFKAVRFAPFPAAYIFDRRLQTVVDNLRHHGVVVEEIGEDVSLDVDTLMVDEVVYGEPPFQKHREASVKGHVQRQTVRFAAGSILVRTAQTLAPLIFYLLEPESDDGLTTWNFLDAHLSKGRPHPIYKIMSGVRIASRVLS